MEAQNRNIFKLTATVVENRIFLVVLTFAFVAIGVLVGSISPSKYESSIAFIPEVKTDDLPGGLGGLASLAGVSVSGSSNGSVILPITYPQLLSSTSFKKKLLETKLPSQNDSITYYQYLESLPVPTIELVKKYTLGLPKLVLSRLR